MRSLSCAATALAVFAGALPAAACVAPAPPSNFELVKDTGAIVLGRVVSSTDAPSPLVSPKGAVSSTGAGAGGIQVRVEQVLKGEVSQKDLSVPGSTGRFDGRSDDGDFSEARPGAYRGSCIAYDYRENQLYLLFLSKRGDSWGLNGIPFARINEEVGAPSSPWVRAVREYVRIDALNDYEKEKAELKSLASRMPLLAFDGVIPGLVKDIEAHLQRPSSLKSYADLEVLFRQADSDKRRADILEAMAAALHPQARPLMTQMLLRADAPDVMNAAARYLAGIKDRDSLHQLARLYIAKDDPQHSWALMNALMAIAGDEDIDLMLTVLKVAAQDEESLARAAGWFTTHRSEGAIQILRDAQTPYADTWSLPEDLKGLVADKYTRSWKITLALAKAGDSEVIAWAREALRSRVHGRWIVLMRSRYHRWMRPIVSRGTSSKKVAAT